MTYFYFKIYTAESEQFKQVAEEIALRGCASHQDGDCYHKECPQLRDDEPKTSGRSCPLYDWDREYD